MTSPASVQIDVPNHHSDSYPKAPPGAEIRGRRVGCWKACVTCCSRGGCCRQAPAKFVVEQESGTIVRINLIISVRGCCKNEGSGLNDDAPEALFESGLSPLEFSKWMLKLEQLSSLRNTICQDVCACFGYALLPCLWFSCCKRTAANVRKWNTALMDWQSEFSSTVLKPLGMYCKTQSRCDVTYDKNGKHRYIERWVAFALTPEESERLKLEPHLQGDIETGCCGGVNEMELCVHP